MHNFAIYFMKFTLILSNTCFSLFSIGILVYDMIDGSKTAYIFLSVLSYKKHKDESIVYYEENFVFGLSFWYQW